MAGKAVNFIGGGPLFSATPERGLVNWLYTASYTPRAVRSLPLAGWCREPRGDATCGAAIGRAA